LEALKVIMLGSIESYLVFLVLPILGCVCKSNMVLKEEIFIDFCVGVEELIFHLVFKSLFFFN